MYCSPKRLPNLNLVFNFHGMCSKTGNLEEALKKLGELSSNGLVPDVSTCNSMIDGLCL